MTIGTEANLDTKAHEFKQRDESIMIGVDKVENAFQDVRSVASRIHFQLSSDGRTAVL